MGFIYYMKCEYSKKSAENLFPNILLSWQSARLVLRPGWHQSGIQGSRMYMLTGTHHAPQK